MKKISVIILILAIAPSISIAQNNKYNKILDELITEGMEQWHIPGLSAIIVKDQEIVYQKSFGLQNINTKDKVNDQTLFSMASTTKAITAICLGMLVDEGKVNWNDRVIDHYSEFRLGDDYVTSTATIKDLLIHNLGFHGIQGDFRHISVSTRDEVYAKFEDMDQRFPFRSSWQYSNEMYAIAGVVIEKLSGQSFAEFVKARIFNPLEMNRSVVLYDDLLNSENKATPHDYNSSGELYIIERANINYFESAGSIWSCSDDISKYLKFLLNNGQFNGTELLKKETFDYLFKPHITLTGEQFGYPIINIHQPKWKTYGLGWFQHDFYDSKVDMHTGSLPGLIAITGIIRDKNIAVYLFANVDHAEFRHAFLYKALDLYAFNKNEINWSKEVYDLKYSKGLENRKKKEERLTKKIVGTEPSHEYEDYEGKYVHENLGGVTIKLEGGQLIMTLNNMKPSLLEHWHYETFISKESIYWGLFNPMVTFMNGEDGGINTLRLLDQFWIKN